MDEQNDDYDIVSHVVAAGPSNSAAHGPEQDPPAISSLRPAGHIGANPRISRAEKDIDDPNSPAPAQGANETGDQSTLVTLSRLFAGQPSPAPSRMPSNAKGVGLLYTRNMASEPTTLAGHLYTRGLLGGRHSDITVIAFGQKYALHRLILDRAPFFANALSEPWNESHSTEISIHPEEIDSNITQDAFELALKCLYGCEVSTDDDSEAIGMFATGCWLEMQDLIDLSTEGILRLLSPQTLSYVIRIVTTNYYGRHGERVLASAKSMLCRDGWEMSLRFWDDIPGEIVAEIVAGDGFFVESEWDRWVLAKRLLDRRLKLRAVDMGLRQRGRTPTAQAPNSPDFLAARFNPTLRKHLVSTEYEAYAATAQWVALYTHPDVEPLITLLEQGIHYIHLDFEQLQVIRKTRDIFGLAVLSENIISNALWLQTELRQKVLNADELDLELGLAKSIPNEGDNKPVDQQTPESAKTESHQATSKRVASKQAKGKQAIGKQPAGKEPASKEPAVAGTKAYNYNPIPAISWSDQSELQRFWIPSTDCNIVMGNNAEPIVTTSNSAQRHATRSSIGQQPEDAPWMPLNIIGGPVVGSPRANNFGSGSGKFPSETGGYNAGQPRSTMFTKFPPFRFSAEFPNARLLKEKKRVYSRTVFYAGSLWNIYIQKVKTAKNPQLGVYLHRAKEQEAEEVISGAATLVRGSNVSVDERIGLLEREMLLRSERRERRIRVGEGSPNNHNSDPSGEEDASGSGGDGDTTLVSDHASSSIFAPNVYGQPSAPAIALSASDTIRGSKGESIVPGQTQRSSDPYYSETDSDTDHEEAYRNPSLSPLQPQRRARTCMATIPPYVDSRSTVKTYFKIYSPSKGGRMLSVYESAPDKFNFSQSWGWKSSTLLLDDGFVDPTSTPGQDGASARKNERKLRFMVVIGNL